MHRTFASTFWGQGSIETIVRSPWFWRTPSYTVHAELTFQSFKNAFHFTKGFFPFLLADEQQALMMLPTDFCCVKSNKRKSCFPLE